jgi:hypothetical protein
LKRSKCQLLAPSVQYLGVVLDSQSVRPTADKVQAVKEAPRPTCVNDLKAYLGLINYYGKSFPNLADALSPLYQLLKKDTRWVWGEEQRSAFAKSKALLSSEKLLAHYNPDLSLFLACDASPVGVAEQYYLNGCRRERRGQLHLPYGR